MSHIIKPRKPEDSKPQPNQPPRFHQPLRWYQSPVVRVNIGWFVCAVCSVATFVYVRDWTISERRDRMKVRESLQREAIENAEEELKKRQDTEN